MRKLVITLETPDELDPSHVANVMCDELYYSRSEEHTSELQSH